MSGKSGDVSLDLPQGVNIRKVVNKAYLGIIPFLFITTTLTYIDRSNVSFASLQFKSDLGLTAGDYGLGAGLFYLSYALLQVPANLVTHHVGAPTWLGFLIFCWGIVAACSAAMKTKGQYYAVRLLLGVFEAGCFPGSFYHLTLFFTSLEVGFAYASVASSTALSNIIGAPLAAGILLMDGVGHLRGWQWIFILEGAVTALYGLVLKFLLAGKPSTAYFLKPDERAWLSNRQSTLDAAQDKKYPRQGKWWAAIPDWKIYYVSVCYAILQFGITGIVFFNPFIVEALFFGGNFSGKAPKLHFKSEHDQAWHNAKVALISTVLWVPVAAGMIFNSWSAKHFKERNLHSAVPAFLACICFFVAPVTVQHSPVGGYILIIVAATGVWAPHGPLWSWPKTFLHGQGIAVGSAIFNGGGAIGGFAGPYVIGSLVDKGGFTNCMYVLGALFFALSVIVLLYHPKDLEREDLSKYGDVEVVAPAASQQGPEPLHVELTEAEKERRMRTV